MAFFHKVLWKHRTVSKKIFKQRMDTVTVMRRMIRSSILVKWKIYLLPDAGL